MAAKKPAVTKAVAKAQKKIKELKTVDPLLATRGAPTKPIKHKVGKPELDAEIADKNHSIFQKRLKAIRKAAKRHDYGEAAMLKMYKGMLDMVLGLIPLAEINYRTYKVDRSAYALNVMVNQAREIGNDMRSLQDFNAQAERIVEMARRQFTLIAQAMVDEVYRMKKEIHDDMPPKKREKLFKRIDAMVHGHGRYLNESVKALSDAILAYMTDRRVGGKSVQNGSSNAR